MGIAIGMISFSYNTDKNSVKKSFQWLARLILGGSDNIEGEEVAERLLKLKEVREARKQAKIASKKAKKMAKYAKRKNSVGNSASESTERQLQ